VRPIRDCESLGRIPRNGACSVTKYSFSRQRTPTRRGFAAIINTAYKIIAASRLCHNTRACAIHVVSAQAARVSGGKRTGNAAALAVAPRSAKSRRNGKRVKRRLHERTDLRSSKRAEITSRSLNNATLERSRGIS